MRVSKITGALLAGALLTVSVGLTACSSSSSASGSSGSEASAAASGEASASGSADTGRPPVTAESACAAVNTDAAGAMANFTSTSSDDWTAFSDEVLGLSSDATEDALQGALMNVAVAAQFTVTGLESGDPLATAKGDFDTTMADFGKLCTAAGTPLTFAPAASGAASGAASSGASSAASSAAASASAS